jgi:hypothetical protein
MTERLTVGLPLDIDRIERARAEGNCVELRLTGRWLDPGAADEEELLVVQIEGRRHRFPGTRDEGVSRDSAAEEVGSRAPGSAWAASFTLPDWAEPRHEGQAALWLGSAVVPVPLPGRAPPARVEPPPSRVEPPPSRVEPPPDRAPVAPPPGPPPPLEAPIQDDVAGEAPRSGPLSDMLLKETVAALHTELEQRTSETVRLRGALADARSELEARIATTTALEAAHEQLRAELGQLTVAVETHRQERETRGAEAGALRERLAAAEALVERRAAEGVRLREELAAAQVARDAAVGEAAGLRSELERIGTELAATRERLGAEGGDLGDAQRLLADAKALAEQLRGQ